MSRLMHAQGILVFCGRLHHSLETHGRESFDPRNRQEKREKAIRKRGGRSDASQPYRFFSRSVSHRSFTHCANLVARRWMLANASRAFHTQNPVSARANSCRQFKEPAFHRSAVFFQPAECFPTRLRGRGLGIPFYRSFDSGSRIRQVLRIHRGPHGKLGIEGQKPRLRNRGQL